MPQQIQKHHALYKDLCAISGQDNVSDEEYVSAHILAHLS